MSTVYYKPRKNTIGALVSSWTDLTVPDEDNVSYLVDPEKELQVKVDITVDPHDGEVFHKTQWSDGSLHDSLDAWTIQGAQDIIQMLEMTNPRDLELFVVPRTMSQNGLVLETNSVSGVELYKSGNQTYYPAVKGHKKHMHQYKASDSLYFATIESPIWFMDQGKVHVFPFDTTLYNYYVWTLDYPTHGAYWTSTVEDDDYVPNPPPSERDGTYTTRELCAIDDYIVLQDNIFQDWVNDNVHVESPNANYRVPEKYNTAIALYVGIQLMGYRKRGMWKKLPPTVDYNATQEEADQASAGWEKVRWYVEQDEDSELVQMKIAELNGEQQKFVLDYQWYDATEKELTQRYQQFFQIETQKKDN
tara:strand:+ start:1370 stop:2452 length:1083 start_codon:yes stop_codon:yes gene_type:complete